MWKRLMEKSRYNEEQIIGFLKVQQMGLPVAEICRKHGIGDATFDTWRSRRGVELFFRLLDNLLNAFDKSAPLAKATG